MWGTHIAPYSPVSQPVSGLGLGPTAPFMNAAFVLSGILLLLGVAGIFQGISEMNPRARWICAGLLALSPVGAIVRLPRSAFTSRLTVRVSIDARVLGPESTCQDRDDRSKFHR